MKFGKSIFHKPMMSTIKCIALYKNSPKTNLLLNHCIRLLSTKQPSYEEVRIPVPWGHIAAKWWGPQDKRPILASHGWQDNCGTFDAIIPYLPSHIGILAIDSPGHGLSTPLPRGMFYHGIDNSIFIKRVIDYFQWPKVSLLGHSLGAIANYVYTLLYPDTVDFLVCLDGLKPFVNEENKIKRIVTSIDDFLKYDELLTKDEEPPSYTFEELAKRLHEATRGFIDLNCCHYILKRNTKPSKNDPYKFYFARDPRLKAGPLIGWSQEDLVKTATRITCPIFISKAHSSPFMEKKENVFEVLEVIKKSNKACEFHEIPGTHHVHLNNPEPLGKLVNAFIMKYDVEDRSIGGIKPEIKQ